MKHKLVVLGIVALTFSSCLSTTKQPITTPPTEAYNANPHIKYGIRGCDCRQLDRTGYIACHDNAKKIPLWVSYYLTSADLETSVERKDVFAPDPDLPPGQRAELADYKGSGYDRGHMAPADDLARSREIMNESFYLSNMCPQNGSLNSGKWRYLEGKIQDFCRQNGPIWVITGPIFGAGSESGSNYTPAATIGAGMVWVPAAFYKIVVFEKDGHLTAMAFKMPNTRPPPAGEVSSKAFLERSLTTVDDIESLTNLDFLYLLPDNIEQGVEQQKNNLLD